MGKTCVFGQPMCYEQPGDDMPETSSPRPELVDISDMLTEGASTAVDRVGADVGVIVNGRNTMWTNLRKMLGLDEECLNQGTMMVSGECVCMPHYVGKLCEKVDCQNNSTYIEFTNTCECDAPRFIRGKFCEQLRCENNGTPLNGLGRCECLENWYMGRFCEQYTAPWMYIFGGAGVALLLLVILCIWCQMRVRDGSSPASRRTSNVQLPNRRPLRPEMIGGRAATLQLHLNDRGEQEMRLVPPPRDPNIPPSYYMNAGIVNVPDGGGDKPSTPPPSYDQVMNETHRFPRAVSVDETAAQATTQQQRVALPPPSLARNDLHVRRAELPQRQTRSMTGGVRRQQPSRRGGR